jgi:type II secretory pathway pseudopilin PulG
MKPVARQIAVEHLMPPASGDVFGDEGYILLALVVATALILLALSVAAADIAFTLHREREAESVRRANQYVRAIQLYYGKFNHYPGSIEQLENTNNIRFLRQRYVDPLTGKSDWRLIAPGQNQTTVKGFFGEDLGGIATGGLGAAAGMQAGVNNGTTTTNGASGVDGSTGSNGSSPAATGQPGSGLGSAADMKSSGMGDSGTSGPLMGIGSSATGASILVVNGQSSYETWEFLYDPRIERLKVAAQLSNGGINGLGGSSSQTPNSLGQPGAGLNQPAPSNVPQNNNPGAQTPFP